MNWKSKGKVIWVQKVILGLLLNNGVDGLDANRNGLRNCVNERITRAMVST